MFTSANLASLRQLLVEESSWSSWNRIVEELDELPDSSEKMMATDMVEAHLEGWTEGWRQGNHQWAEDSIGWKLVRRRQQPIASLPDAEEVWCPPSQLMIGTDENEEVVQIDPESPKVCGRLTYGYWMQTTSVTQAQWQSLMGSNPSHHKGDENRPVEQVSWFDAVMFCNALSRQEGLEEAYLLQKIKGVPGMGDGSFSATVLWKSLMSPGYRLPTELEWELACRAGSLKQHYAPLEECAWYDANGGEQTQAVGLKLPNAWGLYDMLGNVYDWCWQFMGEYSEGELLQDAYTRKPGARVYRGGNFGSYHHYCRAAFRLRSQPYSHYSGVGFRLCRTATI